MKNKIIRIVGILFLFSGISVNVDSHNGKSKYQEPENSMSPKYQNDLVKMIEDYARYFKCRFIIATHSPFLLAISDVWN